MKPHRTYVPEDSVFPLRGLDSVSPSTMSHPAYWPDASNMMILDGVSISRSGYELLGAAVDGTVIHVEEFIGGDGTKTMIALTLKREYSYDSANDEWDEITAGFAAVAELNDNGGAVDTIVLTGDLTLTYVSGSQVTVTDSASNDGTYTLTIDSTFAAGETTLTVATGTLAATENPAPGACRARQDRTGTELNVIDSAQGTDANGTYLFITNDVDFPRYYNGSGVFAVADDVALTYTSFQHCKTIEIIDEYLILGNVYLTSDNQRVIANSDTLDFFEFTSGNSATLTLADAIGGIQKCEKISDRVAVYADNSIHLFTHIGGDALFGQERVFVGVAPVGPRAIVNLGAFHIFISQDRAWVFDGTRLVRPFGEDTIATKLRENLDPELKSRVISFNDAPNRHAYWIIPTDETHSLTLVCEYDVSDFRRSKWMPLTYTARPTAFGWYSRHDDVTWSGLQTSNPDLDWDELALDWDWNDRSSKQGFASRIMAAGSSIYRCEDTTANDDGTAFTAYEDTIDFTVPRSYRSTRGRWLEVEIELRGKSCDVLYSTDQGESFAYAKQSSDASDADGITLTSVWTFYKFFIDVNAELIRVRVQAPDLSQGFSRRLCRLWVTEGGPR